MRANSLQVYLRARRWLVGVPTAACGGLQASGACSASASSSPCVSLRALLSRLGVRLRTSDWSSRDGGRGSGDRETDEAPHRDELAWITFEGLDQRFEFIRRRPPVPLGALSDQTETAECDTRKTHVLGRDVDPVDRRGVREHSPDEREVDGERGWASALFRSPLAVFDEARSIQLGDLGVANGQLERFHDRRLRAAYRFPDLVQVMDVEADRIAEGLGRAFGASFRLKPMVDTVLGVQGPRLCVSPSSEGVGGVAALATNLRAPVARG